ncbi:hypothetical protein [Burkholderia multivorans]|nr:hypothetical protein [Burkholderia multivorans]AIO72590.1 hypothetical protein DM80_5194 [Burkholderia multivorans]
MSPSDVRGCRPTQRGLEAAVGPARQRDGEEREVLIDWKWRNDG